MLQLGQYLEIHGKGCSITIEARPSYCDRGNFIAKLFATSGLSLEHVPHIDGADGWPRYFFDLERAKAECVAWLEKRKQVLPNLPLWVEKEG